MDEAATISYITTTFASVETVIVSDNSFFFYDLERKFPFATLMTNDDNDNASALNRPRIFRLNIGISKPTFRTLFGASSPAPDADNADANADAYDFTALDRLLPHPVYGRMFWVCVLNPSATTFATAVQPLLAEAYDIAVGRETRRAARS